MGTSCQSFGKSFTSGVRGDTRVRNTDLGIQNKEILEALRVECVFPRSGDLEKRVKDRTLRKIPVSHRDAEKSSEKKGCEGMVFMERGKVSWKLREERTSRKGWCEEPHAEFSK